MPSELTEKLDKRAPHPLKAFVSGTVSGLVCCFIFNPWDKALYLSVKSKRCVDSVQSECMMKLIGVLRQGVFESVELGNAIPRRGAGQFVESASYS
jgi:hypothetical protein